MNLDLIACSQVDFCIHCIEVCEGHGQNSFDFVQMLKYNKKSEVATAVNRRQLTQQKCKELVMIDLQKQKTVTKVFICFFSCPALTPHRNSNTVNQLTNEPNFYYNHMAITCTRY